MFFFLAQHIYAYRRHTCCPKCRVASQIRSEIYHSRYVKYVLQYLDGSIAPRKRKDKGGFNKPEGGAVRFGSEELAAGLDWELYL